MTGTDVMPQGRASVLLAIVRLHAIQGRVTARAICAATGFRSTSTVQSHINRLVADGLVIRDPDKHGTLRPGVEVFAV